jgi:hypothetical protein
MVIPYRTRRFLKSLATFLLALVLLLILVWGVWILWLDRYVIYSRDGAKLDFTLQEPQSGQLAVPPAVEDPITIYYNEGENALNTSTELTQLFGYYITTTMLMENPTQVLDLVRKLPDHTPVLIEMKDIVGRCYYQSEVAPVKEEVDMDTISKIVEHLTRSNLYAIARIPAFRDYTFGLNNVPFGLPHRSGRGLWMDEARCYWLNPGADGALNYLVSLVEELKAMGFNEVLLGDFRFPNTDQIKFNGSKSETLISAAQRLATACATNQFCLSFLIDDTDFTLPAGRTRVYLENRTAADVKTLAEKLMLEEPSIKMAFITDLKDTRFDAYGVLRPITSVDPEELA